MAAGIATGFVRKLYRILDLESDAVISWDPTGDSFSIHDADALNDKVLPRYFRGRICAFRQQLIDHGFEQLECEDNETRESYRHVHFVRGCPAQLSLIVRVPKPKRKQQASATAASRQRVTAAPTATTKTTATTTSSSNATVSTLLQVKAPPRLLTVTLNGVKRASPSASAAASEAQQKRLRTMDPSASLRSRSAYSSSTNTVHLTTATAVATAPAPSPTTATSANPLFSSSADASALSFARLAESGLLPHSSDLPEPISYLSKPLTSAQSLMPTHARVAEPPMFSDDLFRSALFFLASGSTTGIEVPAPGPAPASGTKPSVDANGDMTVPSNLLSMLLASSTSAMPAASSSSSGAWGTGAANPLFSDQSTADDDEDQDSIWNLLVASSVDRTKSAISAIETPLERLRVILAERERLEEQRKKLFQQRSSSTVKATNSATGGTTATTTVPAAAATTNPLFAKPPPATTNPLFAKPPPAATNPLFAKPPAAAATGAAVSANSLFAKATTTSSSVSAAAAAAAANLNPLFAKPKTTSASASASRPPHEDDLWRLLMSSSIDSFRRIGEFDV